MTFDGAGVVLAHTWVRLLEVDVNSDGLHIVQWVLLVEWQTEISLELHLWASHVLLYGARVVLARPHIDGWVSGQHLGILDESFLLRGEVRVELLAVESNVAHHGRGQGRLNG